jgi:hypothetical protein
MKNRELLTSSPKCQGMREGLRAGELYGEWGWPRVLWTTGWQGRLCTILTRWHNHRYHGMATHTRTTSVRRLLALFERDGEDDSGREAEDESSA